MRHVVNSSLLLGLVAVAVGCGGDEAPTSTGVDSLACRRTSTCGNSQAACRTCPGPAPAAPTVMCSDGTTGGPACVSRSDGTCGWTVIPCPTP
jgi:hypothetical protein